MSKVYIYLVIKGHEPDKWFITSSHDRLDTLNDVEWILTDIREKALEYYQYYQRTERDMCILHIIEPYSEESIDKYIRKLTTSKKNPI